MDKIVYQLDPNGVLVGEAVANECERTPGYWLIPGGCVDTETLPPVVQEGFAARFVDGEWVVVEDHRRNKLFLYDGRVYQIDDEVNGQRYDGLGPLPAWLSVVEPPPALEEQRMRKLYEIDNAFSAAAESMLSGYPHAERLTWPTQQQEALAWAANNSAPTPYLDGLAAARGITAEDMRARTLDAVQTWMAASQLLVGRRQALRDAAQLAADEETLAAITWEPVE